jgi:histidine ammonia-lyase
MKQIVLGVDGMSLEDLAAIAMQGARVRLAKKSEQRIVKSRALVDKWLREGRVIYGVTTGFGALSNVMIGAEAAGLLQQNILLSHSAGVGEELDADAVRAMMALRIKDLARGHSGIRLITVQRLIELLNRGVVPAVPEKGSVGACGDLAPLAHMCLPLIGLGEALYKGERVSGAQALSRCGLEPLQLEAAEGLALLNGTQMSTAIGGLAAYDAEALCKLADIAAAMSLEVLMGSRVQFDPRIHEVRPHPGQAASAYNMRRITQNSEIVSSHKDCGRIQDAYTLRCSPQVHGAGKDAIAYARRVLETEMNSSTNNPLIFADSEEFVLGGNFHGHPVGVALDFLAVAVAGLANISERRIERLVNPQLSGLPAFLVSEGGLNSGFMIAQYTAASLVSENKVLAHPASVDSIPTSANREDIVPMSAISARKCSQIVKNAQFVIAIELLCGAQALDLFTNLKPGTGTMAAYKTIRSRVPHLDKDRILSCDINATVSLIKRADLLKAVESAVGNLV